jgi:16S rRNA (guanine527-N7)-methyltransferase
LPSIESQLDRYLELLAFWNQRINLTSVRDPEGIREKHFADSLALVPHVPPEARTLVDVGSGAGFPGAVVALARPDLAVTLVESNRKKTAFLETIRRELPIPNVTVAAARLEAFLPAHRRGFDVAVSRATWDLLEWLALAPDLVRSGGLVLAMEGALLHELPPGATRHPYVLGDQRRSIVMFHVEH